MIVRVKMFDFDWCFRTVEQLAKNRYLRLYIGFRFINVCGLFFEACSRVSETL